MVDKTQNSHSVRKEHAMDDVKKADLRRQMYERIAEGHQFAEAEIVAQQNLRKH